MATGENKWLKITDGDVVVISAHPIPGNEWAVGRVVDGLYRRGAEVVDTNVEAVHVSGHARQGELKTMLSVAHPEFFVPVHGEYRHLMNHALLAEQMGVETEKVLVCQDGDAIRIDDRGISISGEVPAGYLYVDGTVGDVGHEVLRDRRVLSEEGVVVVVATVDLHARDLVGDPEIVTRGWVHGPDAEELVEEATALRSQVPRSCTLRRGLRPRRPGPKRPQDTRSFRGRAHQAPPDDRPSHSHPLAVTL